MTQGWRLPWESLVKISVTLAYALGEVGLVGMVGMVLVGMVLVLVLIVGSTAMLIVVMVVLIVHIMVTGKVLVSVFRNGHLKKNQQVQ